jgi:hypothetical protein
MKLKYNYKDKYCFHSTSVYTAVRYLPALMQRAGAKKIPLLSNGHKCPCFFGLFTNFGTVHKFRDSVL